MSSAVFYQVFLYLSTGEFGRISREAITIMKNLNLTTEEMEHCLDKAFNVPAAIETSQRTSLADVIWITAGRYMEKNEEDTTKEKKYWKLFREQGTCIRRNTRRTERLLTEDPEVEALAFQNAWERCGPKEIEGSQDKWEEEANYSLTSGVIGLFRYPETAVWAPMQDEIGLEVFAFSDSGSCVSEDTAYGSCASDSGTSAYDSANQSFVEL